MGKIVFGVDIGGTTVKLGVFTADGTLNDKWEIPTRTEENGRFILADVAQSIHDKIKALGYEKKDVIGVGIGVPGQVNREGVISAAINLGWGTFNLVETLTSMLELPVKAENDANVAALGEMWKGGGQGYDNMVAVTLGTGVGGGVIVDGRLASGYAGGAGEIGHMNVEDREEESCNCGNCGCLEQYASATGIVRLAKKRLLKDAKESMLRDGELSAKSIWDAVKAGDALAIEVAEQFGYYLGKGIANVANVLNPEVFVIGGGMSKAGEVMFEYIWPSYNRFVFVSCREIKFALAKLGNDAGIYGAARLVIEE